MAVATYNLPSNVESEEDKQRRLDVERARRLAALAPTPISPEELALQQASDESTALREGAAMRRSTGPSGTGILGSLGAFLIDKVTGDKREDKFAEQARQGLVQKRKLGNLTATRKSLDKARGILSGQDYETLKQDDQQASVTDERIAKQTEENRIAAMTGGDTETYYKDNGERVQVRSMGRGKGHVDVFTGDPVDVRGMYSTREGYDADRKIRGAKTRMTGIVDSMANDYIDLLISGAGIAGDQSTAENIFSYARSEFPEIERAMGTEAAAIRSHIATQKPMLINYIRQASEMGARGLDSERELDFYLQAATDPQTDVNTNLAALLMLNEAYGLGMEGLAGREGLTTAKEIQDAKKALRKQFLEQDTSRLDRFKAGSPPPPNNFGGFSIKRTN